MDVQSFQLTRLILIDSLCPDRVIELPVEGGAVLTGRNGRGKTSLLQLLLLFYGESPSRIVTAEAGRDSFVGYYLPRATSYIVYEYQRADGLPRMVVAYADRHGERVFYRFVRHAFEIAQFVTTDNELVRTVDLPKHLTANGWQCADWQVETTADYRNIIQGVPSSSTNRQHQQHMRQLALEYGFTNSRQPLRQIEKIVAGMFRRKTNFDDLQSMIIDCVTEDVNSLTISGDRRKIEDWPRGYRAYNAVMAQADNMAQLQAYDEKLHVQEQALAELRAKFHSLLDKLVQDIAQQQQHIQQGEEQLNQQNAQYLEQKEQLTEARLTVKKEAEFAEQQAAKLKQQFDSYQDNNMAAVEARVLQAPVLQQQLHDLRARKVILLGEQEKISLAYEQLKQQQHESFNLYREQVAVQQQQSREQYDARLAQLEFSFNQQQQQFALQHEQGRHGMEQAVHQASEELGRCKAELAHPRPDPKLSALLEQKQITLDAIRQLQLSEDKQRRELERHYQQAKQQFLEQEQTLAAAVRQQQHAEQLVAEQCALLAPDEGSLLFFLKQQYPEWSQDVARVINPELLQRRDLKPEVSDGLGQFYGLSLNLERLEAHPSALPSRAEQAVQQAEQQLSQAQIALSAARHKQDELGKQRESAEAAYQKYERESEQLRLRIDAAQAEVDAVKRQLEQHKQQWQEQAAHQLAKAEQQLQQARQQLQQFDAAFRAGYEQRQQNYQQQRSELNTQRLAEQKQLELHVAQRKADVQQTLSQLEQERDTALQQQGVDTQQLQQLDQQLKTTQQALAEIDVLSPQVEKWRYWMRDEWPNFQEFTAQAELARSQEQHWLQQLLQLEQSWLQQKHRQESELKALRRLLQQFAQQQQLAQQQLPQLQAYAELTTPSYDPGWSLDMLTGQLNQLLQTSKQLESQIVSGLKDLARIFLSYSGTPPEQYWQHAVANHSIAPSREWVKPLKRWFDREHQEYKRVLLMEAGSIAGEIELFHKRLTNFHTRVLAFNRDLQQHLDTSLAFESISQINVEVVSTLHELKYWAAICELAAAYGDWNAGLNSELPPVEFASNLEQLLEHWEVKAGIRADFINLIRLQGEVTENGHRRVFKRASDLEVVSSNGLSYLILATIFVAFINRIRRDAPVNIVWALDELKDLDAGNVISLMTLLKRNNITLVSAFPDPDPDALALFKHAYTIDPDRRLVRVEVQHV